MTDDNGTNDDEVFRLGDSLEPLVGYQTEGTVWAFRAGYAVAHAQAMARTLRHLAEKADISTDTAGFALQEARPEVQGHIAAHAELMREVKGWS